MEADEGDIDEACDASSIEKVTVCLVNFASKAECLGNVMMRYILAMQDNESKFTLLRPLRDLDTTFLAYEVSSMLAILGCSNLFGSGHREQGNQYIQGLVNQIVAERVNDRRLGMNEQTRRLRAFVERELNELLEKENAACKVDPNWVHLLPSVMATMNKGKVLPIHSVAREEPLPPSNKRKDSPSEVPTSHTKVHIDEDCKVSPVSTKVPIDEDCKVPPIDEDSKVPPVSTKIPVDEALTLTGCSTRTVAGQAYRVAYPQLLCHTCDDLFGHASRLLSVAEDNFYQNYAEKRWWEADMVCTFGFLKAHEAHRDDMLFVDAGTPTKKQYLNTRKGRELPQSVTTILAVALKSSHFVVLQLKLDHNTTIVHDGLLRDENQWTDHQDYILSQYVPHPKVRLGGPWRIRHAGSQGPLPRIYRQQDQHNCGPIACMVLWTLLDGKEFVKETYVNTETSFHLAECHKWREICLRKLQTMLKLHRDSMFVIKRNKG